MEAFLVSLSTVALAEMGGPHATAVPVARHALFNPRPQPLLTTPWRVSSAYGSATS
jgi:hypothetical protein